MKMNLPLFALSIMFIGAACGSDAPTAAGTCNDIDQAICERFLECFSAEELMDATLESCIASRQENRLMVTGLACEEFTESNSNCASGQVYNSDTASVCNDNIRTVSCDSFRADQSPGECENVCEAAP